MAGTKQIREPARASIKIALGFPRAEAKGLDSYLQTVLPDPVPGYSRALLGRALAEFALRSRVLGGNAIGVVLLVFLVPAQLFAIGWFSAAGWAECSFLVAAYLLLFLLVGWMQIVGEERGEAEFRKRKRQLLSKETFLEQEKKRRSGHWSLLGAVALLAAVAIYLAQFLEDRWLPATIKAAAAFVWGFVLLYFWMLISRYMLMKRAAHAMIVRALASACAVLQIASPADWRSPQYRRRAAAHLSEAASIVEGAVLRILSAIPVSHRTPEWGQVRASAASLRRLAAKIVTRGPDGRSEIERSLTTAVATAVAGGLVAVESDILQEEDGPRASRLGRLVAVLQKVVVAFLPAIGVTALILAADRYGWEWSRDARPLLIQFAVVSVLIGLMSALDPSGYQQRLNSITGAGASMFGRRG